MPKKRRLLQKLFLRQPNFIEKTFGTGVELLPSVTELFEFEMAFMEYNRLDKSELIERGAFFKKIAGKETLHYKTYSLNSKSLSDNRSSLTKTYFENGQFSTGYATHSLFPYRGKFHPQLIKG
ncbi:MAG: hypothetical protein ACE5EA_08585, partial [Nitrospirota bacterium]